MTSQFLINKYMPSPLPSPLLHPPARLQTPSPLPNIQLLEAQDSAQLPFGIVPCLAGTPEYPCGCPGPHLDASQLNCNAVSSLLNVRDTYVSTMSDFWDAADRLDHGILSEWSYDDLRGVKWIGDSQGPTKGVRIPIAPQSPPKHVASPPRMSTRSSSKSGGGNVGESSDETRRAEGPRPRGRPHLGLSPETTVERRRAQVRIAQRTYRQRREATISTLEERNRHLEEVMEGMTESFLKLQAVAMKVSDREKKPELAEQLQRSTAEFLALARSANV